MRVMRPRGTAPTPITNYTPPAQTAQVPEGTSNVNFKPDVPELRPITTVQTPTYVPPIVRGNPKYTTTFNAAYNANNANGDPAGNVATPPVVNSGGGTPGTSVQPWQNPNVRMAQQRLNGTDLWEYLQINAFREKNFGAFPDNTAAARWKQLEDLMNRPMGGTTSDYNVARDIIPANADPMTTQPSQWQRWAQSWGDKGKIDWGTFLNRFPEFAPRGRQGRTWMTADPIAMKRAKDLYNSYLRSLPQFGASSAERTRFFTPITTPNPAAQGGTNGPGYQ